MSKPRISPDPFDRRNIDPAWRAKVAAGYDAALERERVITPDNAEAIDVEQARLRTFIATFTSGGLAAAITELDNNKGK